MDTINLDAYIFFAGNCREAMEFYHQIFGGELSIQNYDDVPSEASDEMRGKVIHASLTGGDITLMGSDAPAAKSLGSGKVSLSLSGYNEEKLRGIFDQLGEGGSVDFPLKKEFWGDTFGSLTDAFGVTWMVNISARQDQNEA